MTSCEAVAEQLAGAQEMGEVAHQSIHYRALFMVGLVLFILSLAINYAAQHIVRKYRISIG